MMPKLFFNAPKLFALSTAIISSMGVLNAPEANALTFKGTIYESPFEFLENREIQYSNPCSSCGRRPLPQPLSYKERGASEGINHLGLLYTLADGIFDTIIASPINTFFTDEYPQFGPEPTEPLTLPRW